MFNHYHLKINIKGIVLYKLYFSKNQGLHLIMDDVVESGPAWESGVRKGDVIVTVNDWLIVLMDRPQVSKILYSNLLKKKSGHLQYRAGDQYKSLIPEGHENWNWQRCFI